MSRIIIEISARQRAAGEALAVYLQGVLDQVDVTAVIDTPGRGRVIPPETAASVARHQLRDLVGRGTRIAIRVAGAEAYAAAAAAAAADPVAAAAEPRQLIPDDSVLAATAVNFASERGLDGERRPTLDDLLDFLDRVGRTTMGPIVTAMGGDAGAVGDLLETAAAYLHIRDAQDMYGNKTTRLYSRARRDDEGSTHG